MLTKRERFLMEASFDEGYGQGLKTTAWKHQKSTGVFFSEWLEMSVDDSSTVEDFLSEDVPK